MLQNSRRGIDSLHAHQRTSTRRVPAGPTAEERSSRIIAALRRGLTRTETARRFGVSYWVVAKAARDWEMSGGEPLPRDRRGRPRQSLHQVTSRERDVVTHYRSPARPTMRALAAQYGLSAERVRQLIQCYERKTGDKVQRNGRR